jgi:Tfp pilus assembly protein PilX
MRARLRSEQGWVLVTAMLVMTVMLGAGFAVLSIVDTQSKASGVERVSDSTFNLAEGVLNSDAFLLSRNWPELASQTPAGLTTACGLQSYTGTLATALPTSVAGQIQNLVNQTFSGGDYTGGATWKVNICDDTGRTNTWDDSLLTAPAYDSNGPDPTTGIRRLWVRAQSTVKARSRAVVALVQVNVVPTMPPKFAMLAGGFSTDLTATTGALTSGVAGELVKDLTGSDQLIKPDPSDPSPPAGGSGKIGVRCAVLNLCVTGAFTALGSGLDSFLLGNDYIQYGSPTAASDDAIAQLRKQAQTSGTYYASIANGANCLPASPAGKVIFIEQVGNGSQNCVIAATSSAKAVIVGSGGIAISGANTLFTGVVYALNRQRLTLGDTGTREVVSISTGAKVKGAVYADGASGKVGIYPPSLSVANLCTALLPGILNAVLCGTLNALGVTGLLDGLVSRLGVGAVATALLPQLASYGPAILDDKATIAALTTYGSSGTIAGTFRQVPPS